MNDKNLNMPLISVIVPVYKTEKYLQKCVDSILNQTYQNLEVFLVDDGSPDNCPKVCDSYAEKDNRVKVIHKENGGLSSARNSALDLATGDLISFVDSDDWLELEAYEKLISFMLKENLDIVFMTANRISDNAIPEMDFEYYPDKSVVCADEVFKKVLQDEIGSQVWMKIYKKHIWKDIRFPVGRIYEDIAISQFVFSNAKGNIGFLNTPLYNYLINNEGISLSFNPKKAYHIYLGMKDHYDFAIENKYPEATKCLYNTVIAGMSVINGALDNDSLELKNYANDVENFLDNNKKEVLNCKFKIKHTVLVRIYYLSKGLYKKFGLIYSKLRKR